MSRKRTLFDIASVLRSKNSGPFAVTFDVLFDDWDTYSKVKARGVLTRERIARLYGIHIADVSDIVYFDSALGIKVTIARRVSSGSPLDTDVYGAQQHAPLMNIPID